MVAGGGLIRDYSCIAGVVKKIQIFLSCSSHVHCNMESFLAEPLINAFHDISLLPMLKIA
jgi:hypothetical protein